MSDQNTTEARLARLENFAEAVVLRQDGEDLLQAGVNRLSAETNSLNAILQKIDEQQQRLAALDLRTVRVEETAVSRDELISAHEEQEREAFEFRKKTLKRIYLTVMMIIGSLFIGSLIFFEFQSNLNKSRYRVCVDRNEQTDILLDILRGVADGDPNRTPANVTEGIRRLEAKIVDCEVLR